MYADGIKLTEAKPKKEMANLITNVIKEAGKHDKDAKKAGEDLIYGINNGIKNEDVQSGAFASIKRFGSNLLSNLKRSLQEKSPSKATNEMGQYLLEGLGLGIEKEENSVFKQVSAFGKNVLSTLSGSLAGGVGFPSINIGKINTSSISRSNAEAENLSLVNSFKQALSEMKIELDDENVGKFVDKKVTKLIYT